MGLSRDIPTVVVNRMKIQFQFGTANLPTAIVVMQRMGNMLVVVAAVWHMSVELVTQLLIEAILKLVSCNKILTFAPRRTITSLRLLAWSRPHEVVGADVVQLEEDVVQHRGEVHNFEPKDVRGQESHECGGRE